MINTRQRKRINPIVAVKAEKRKGQKAERRVTSTEVTRREVAQGAKIEMFIRKKRRQNLITVKTEIRVMSLTKSIKKTQKVEMVRGPGQSPEVKRELPKRMSTDQAAETKTEVGLQHQKREKKKERRTERGAESAAGVGKEDITVIGRVRDKEHPGIKNIEQEAQTGVRLGTRTEAGAQEAGVAGETEAGIDPLIEKSKTERLPARGGDAVAAALRVTEKRKRRVIGAQILKEETSPKTEGARPAKDQIVRKAKIEMIARGIGRGLAPALTATKCSYFLQCTCSTQCQLSIYSGAQSQSSYSTK